MHCRLCGNENNNEAIKLRATMYGTKGEFEYYICDKCGALQIKEVPDDIGSYYANDKYYSFNMDKRKLKNELLFRELSNGYGKHSLLGSLTHLIYPVDYSFMKMLKPEDRILDIGCGEGTFLSWLERLGFKNLFGIEPFIDKEFKSGNVCIYKTDLLNYQADNKYQVITMFHSLEHVYEQQDTVNKVFELLDDDGIFIIQIPFFSKYYWNKYKENLYTLDPPRHFYIHTYKSLLGVCENAGFKPVYFDTEADPAISTMARNIQSGHTEKNQGTNFVSGTVRSFLEMGLRRKLKKNKDGAIATFVFKK